MNKNFIWKINLLNLTDNSIKFLLSLINEKKFHHEHIINYLHTKNIKNIYDIKNITNNAKFKLAQLCIIKQLTIKNYLISNDNTIKLLINIENNIIETVLIPNNKNHFTLCMSSQIGCMLNCSFCYTAKRGFLRNMKIYEIISQLLLAKEKINIIFPHKHITNIVFMGMGEPLLNIKNVLSAIEIIIHNKSHNIHKNKITISTSGIAQKINILNERKIPLALSLHATDNITRTKLMPINKSYPIEKILDECKKYAKNNIFTIEYIMLKDINDTLNNARKLITLLKNIKCKICLIPFNDFNDTKYISTSYSNIIKFQNVLKKNGIMTTIRQKMGADINAACGQLAGNFFDKTGRNKFFKKTGINI